LESTRGQLTPNGVNVIVFWSPVQAGFSGGDAANVLPATSQSIGHATTSIDTGGRLESKMGDGSDPDSGGWLTNLSVEGSIAYCQVSVASNWRSTARDSWAFWARTVEFRGTGVKRTGQDRI